MKKLIPALAMLLVSAVLLGTSTFAWFSMNNRVTVTGMEVKTKVNVNLLIAETNNDANFGASLTQTVKGVLEPASTVDGVAYWYTAPSNVVADGDARTNAYVDYGTTGIGAASDSTTYDDAFSENYQISKTGAAAIITGETKAKAYTDYVFYLKGTNTNGSAQNIKMTKCDLIYDTGAATSETHALNGKSFRVAMFVQAAVKDTPLATPIVAGDRKTILAPSGAVNFTTGEAVNSASSTAAVTYSTAANVAELAAGETGYFKVTVRLWLEGEDNTCNNETFALLTEAYKLNLEFQLGDGTPSAVTNIAQYTSATVSGVQWFYDGTYVWNNIANIGTETGRTDKASATTDVKTAFGIPTTP